jgi:hypothetical protein
MSKRSLLRAGPVVWLVILLASLSLAACGGATPSPTSEGAAPAESEAAVSTEEPATEVPAAEEATAVVEAPSPTTEAAPPTVEASGPASCEAVNIPTNEAISPVADEEWSKGPVDAPVTVIEYGDFQ